MIDRDLAELYQVDTRYLNKQVKRNITRFPEDFMFQLNTKEFKNLMFQIGTSKRGGTRKNPYIFTENGVAMLSSILKSKRAIEVNIQIMRIFTKLREYILTHKDLKLKIEKLERKYKNHDEKINLIFEAIKQLLDPPKPKKEYTIGFRID